MRKSIGLFGAWAGATLLAVAIAAAAVGSVRTQLIDEPTSIGAPAVTLAADDAADDFVLLENGEPEIPSTSTTTSSPIEETTTTSTTTLPPDESTTTINPVVQSSTADTNSDVPTDYTKTYDTKGGTVRIRVTGESVTLVAASPKPGWKVDVDENGPETVEIHFEQNDDDEESEFEFEATLDDGELKITISED
ncbi:MAG: hypothetical protein BMS9Abin12_0922 [Acidimicrobiia bacterium]|nr:MAG: hypothetical protein BMS9Abin12_0922 [Acidimicrobiia bacterium]